MDEPMKNRLSLSDAETQRLRRQLIGKKADHYERRWTKMDARGHRFALHPAGLVLSYLWAFYRGLYGWGILAMASSLAGFYLMLRYGQGDAITPAVIAANALSLWPNLLFGLRGDDLYRRALDAIIQEGLTRPKSKQAAYFKDYEDGNARVVLGILICTLAVAIALILSTGGAGIAVGR